MVSPRMAMELRELGYFVDASQVDEAVEDRPLSEVPGVAWSPAEDTPLPRDIPTCPVCGWPRCRHFRDTVPALTVD